MATTFPCSARSTAPPAKSISMQAIAGGLLCRKIRSVPWSTSRVAARIQLRLWYNQGARGCVRNVLIASHLDEDGEVAEWLKAPASKADVLERVPRVRISPSPPEQFPGVLCHPRYPCSISYLTHSIPFDIVHYFHSVWSCRPPAGDGLSAEPRGPLPPADPCSPTPAS